MIDRDSFGFNLVEFKEKLVKSRLPDDVRFRYDQAPPASESDVRSIEKKIGVKIPSLLREHFVNTSSSTWSFWSIETEDSLEWWSDCVYSGGYVISLGEIPDIFSHYETLIEYTSKVSQDDYFPIMSGACGSFLVISRASGEIGYLYGPDYDEGCGMVCSTDMKFQDFFVEWSRVFYADFDRNLVPLLSDDLKGFRTDSKEFQEWSRVLGFNNTSTQE